MAATISRQVLDEISEIKIDLAARFERDKDTCEKVAAMHKIIVTGNGDPPLPEQVRKNANWIIEQKAAKASRLDTANKLWLLGAGQVLTLIFLAVAVWFGLK